MEEEEEKGAAPEHAPRWPLIVALVTAIGFALYSGFRMPSAWTATLQAVSLTDGFYRRFAVGTLLRPLAEATGYSYALFAAFSFLVLAALLAVLVRATLRARLASRQALVLAWLLIPTGAFLFHEVGYFEQVLYLLLFASMWLVHRGRLAAAAAVIAIAPLVHEISIATVIPLFGIVAWRATSLRRAAMLLAVPVAINALVLVVPPASGDAVATLGRALAGADFVYRTDALDVFMRSQAESWQLYDLHDQALRIKPVAYILVGSLLLVWLADRTLRDAARADGPSRLFVVACCLAVAAPGALMFGGWDSNRWIFLMIANYALVAWIVLEGRRHELRAGALMIIGVTIVLLTRVPLYYFESLAPRELGYRAARHFVKEVRTGALFETPRM